MYVQKLSHDLGSPEITTNTSSSSKRLQNSGNRLVESDNVARSSKAFADLNVSILSVNCKEFASKVSLPQSTVEVIWCKAETLLKVDGSIVSAPGMDFCWYVESKSKGSTPCECFSKRQSSLSCDKACEHYRSIRICSHVVTIAEKVGSLTSLDSILLRAREPFLQT